VAIFTRPKTTTVTKYTEKDASNGKVSSNMTYVGSNLKMRRRKTRKVSCVHYFWCAIKAKQIAK
jgi:hypothetical protein